MTSFITAEIKGGLGNQLFIIFTVMAIAERDKIDYSFIYSSQSPSFLKPRPTYYESLLKRILTIKQLPKIVMTIKENDHQKYQNILPITNPTILKGYFQSRKYIDPIKHNILNYFQIELEKNRLLLLDSIKTVRDMARGRRIIFIHVRRGDYLKSPTHLNLMLDYYQEAIAYHKKIVEMKKDIEKKGQIVTEREEGCFFSVFSDDMDYCRNHLKTLLDSNEIWYSDIETDYLELMFMSYCDGAIIANSTFSWWGAYLSERRKEQNGQSLPLIVSPQKWFTKQNGAIDLNVEQENWTFL